MEHAMADLRDGGGSLATEAPRLRVLVVDDIAAMADALALVIRAEGHDAAAVYGGPEAIEAAGAAQADPATAFDVVLLDFMMPGMNGGEAAEALYRLPRAQQPKIVIHTSMDLNDPRLRGVRCERLIRKTYSMEELIEVLLHVAEDPAADRG
jgi:CheY-like chemotaxis protein